MSEDHLATLVCLIIFYPGFRHLPSYLAMEGLHHPPEIGRRLLQPAKPHSSPTQPKSANIQPPFFFQIFILWLQKICW